jgi:hypothetical protein
VSSPATATGLAAFRRLNARRVGLAKIVLSVPGALTLRYATTETIVDGTLWQTGLTIDPIRESVGYLAPGVSPVETTIRLAKRIDASQTSGTVHDLLSDYLWQNATVTLYLYEVGLTSTDWLQVFKGNVSRPAMIDPEGVTLHLLQDLSWNKIVPTTVVDKTSYPDSPDVSQGLPIPILYGDHVAPGMKSPWATAYGSKQYQEDSGAGLGVVPGVLVDAGVGGASVKVVYAGHAALDILSRANGYSQFIVGNNNLDPLDTTGLTETLGSTESHITVADENAIAYSAVIPIDVRSTADGLGIGNTATDPRRAMDPYDELTYATLNQTTGKNGLQLILPNAGPLGWIESVQVYVAWSGDAANTQNLRVNYYQPGTGAGAAPITWVSTGTALTVQRSTWPTTYWTQDWDFGGTTTVRDIRVDFAGAVANNKARIYWVALVVKYRPQRSVVTPGKTYVSSRTYYQPNPGRPGYEYNPNANRPGWTNNYTTVNPTFKLDSQFYANVRGYADDGSGTYTGSAGSIIERPPDVIRHFLVTYGSVSGGSIETTSSTTGSFVDARSTLRNAQPYDLKLACWIGERTSVQRVLQTMAEQSGMCVYLDRFTDKWLSFVWKPGAVTDYDRALSWKHGDIAAFQCEETSVVDVRHSIRVKFGFDHFKNKSLYEAFVTASASGQGVNLPTIRDQRLTVSASNEDIDFSVGGGAAVLATLTAGTYTPIALAAEARSKCRAVGSNNVDVGYGFSIKAGFNDLLDYTIYLTAYQTTLTAGDYTAEGLAAEVTRAMNEGSSPANGFDFSCTYSHSTNKFSITATATVTTAAVCNNTIGTNTITRLAANGSFLEDGVVVGHYVTHANFGANTRVTNVTATTVTCSGVSALGFANNAVTFEPRFCIDGTTTAAAYLTSAAHVLGQVSLALTQAVTNTFEVERYGDRFWFSYGVAASNINMLWLSGTNTATNAAWLLGYEKVDSGVTRNNPATYSRGDRERTADTYAGYYGPREERQMVADWIRDQTTAVQLRDRIFDLTARPRVVVRFASYRIPDMRRMQVIEFASDLDSVVAYPKYGTNGSWSGKRFRVLEVEQNMGPQFHTEVLAIEAD